MYICICMMYSLGVLTVISTVPVHETWGRHGGGGAKHQIRATNSLVLQASWSLLNSVLLYFNFVPLHSTILWQWVWISSKNWTLSVSYHCTSCLFPTC